MAVTGGWRLEAGGWRLEAGRLERCLRPCQLPCGLVQDIALAGTIPPPSIRVVRLHPTATGHQSIFKNVRSTRNPHARHAAVSASESAESGCVAVLSHGRLL